MVTATPNRMFLYIAASAANLASFLCGTSFGWTSPEIPQLKNVTTSPLDHIITASEEGWIGSFLPLAAAIGPIGGGILADMIGRKKTILFGTLPFLLGFIINVFASSVYIFYITRFLCGLGVGITFTVLPMYIGEISDDEVKGSLGSFMQLFSVLGMLFSYALGPFLSIQMFNILLVFPPAIFMVLFFLFIPDSPYYLVQNEKIEEAVEALMKLRGRERSFVQKEIELMKLQVDDNQKNKGGMGAIFKSVGLRRALIFSLSLVGAQQFSGIIIVLFYTQNIFTDAGVSIAPEICTIIVGVVQIFASSATPVLVEKWGKRVLLILSGLGMSLSLCVLALFFYMKDDCQMNVSRIGWLPVVSIIIYIVTYCLGFGPLPWAVMGELFPGNVKSVASSATASFCWILSFFIAKYFGTVSLVIGQSGSFGFFSICCGIAAACVFKFLPETTGKSFYEIQNILNGNSENTGDLL